MKPHISPWIPDPDYPHSCLRHIVGTDPRFVRNRVDFIEKSPRVRVAPYDGKDDSVIESQGNWFFGRKHSSAVPLEDGTYKYNREAQNWADQELAKLGYNIEK